jgi:hypothetical protein
VPSESGVFTINGNTFVWNNTMSLGGTDPAPPAFPAGTPAPPPGIGGLINVPPATYEIDGMTFNNPFPGWVGSSTIAFNFNPATQTVTLTSTQNGANSPQPIQINDVSGNFTLFTGLNGDTSLGNLASGLVNQVSSNTAGAQLLQSQASNSLTQLQNAQDNIAGIATPGSGNAGVSTALIQQQAVQEMITYNAMLQVLEVIDDMFSDLVGIISSSTPSGSFQNQSSPV